MDTFPEVEQRARNSHKQQKLLLSFMFSDIKLHAETKDSVYRGIFPFVYLVY